MRRALFVLAGLAAAVGAVLTGPQPQRVLTIGAALALAIAGRTAFEKHTAASPCTPGPFPVRRLPDTFEIAANVTATVFAVVLFAAALHATWNAIVKGGGDKTLTTTMVTGSAALVALLILPFVPAPRSGSWAFIAASTVCQIAYFGLIARIYRVSDMSQSYPLMRGAAPLIVAALSASIVGERLAPSAWVGVCLICTGIVGAAVVQWRERSEGVGLALVNALVIASYTLIDGAGVRRSGAPAAYTLWIFLLSGAALASWSLMRRRDVLLRYIAGNWLKGGIGGVGAVASYGLALWAMTLAPIALVAALRESSILFAAAISGLVLKEAVTLARIVGAIIIVAGVAVLRLS